MPYTHFCEKSSTLSSRCQNGATSVFSVMLVIELIRKSVERDQTMPTKSCCQVSRLSHVFVVVSPSHPLNPTPRTKKYTHLFAEGCQWTTLLWCVTYNSFCLKKHPKNPNSQNLLSVLCLNKPGPLDGEQLDPVSWNPVGFQENGYIPFKWPSCVTISWPSLRSGSLESWKFLGVLVTGGSFRQDFLHEFRRHQFFGSGGFRKRGETQVKSCECLE